MRLELTAAEKRGQIKKDSTEKELIGIMQRKGNLGMNAILSQSLALARLTAHMQGKELWEILRETIQETIARTIADNGGVDVFKKDIKNKIKINEDRPLWLNLAEQLDFEELKKGLQQVNLNKSKNVKLFEILRKQLKIY